MKYELVNYWKSDTITANVELLTFDYEDTLYTYFFIAQQYWRKAANFFNDDVEHITAIRTLTREGK